MYSITFMWQLILHICLVQVNLRMILISNYAMLLIYLRSRKRVVFMM